MSYKLTMLIVGLALLVTTSHCVPVNLTVSTLISEPMSVEVVKSVEIVQTSTTTTTPSPPTIAMMHVEIETRPTLTDDEEPEAFSSINKAQLNKAWLEFYTSHTKEFISQDEEALRRERFEENYKQIVEHNELADQGIHLYKLAVNDFSDRVGNNS